MARIGSIFIEGTSSKKSGIYTKNAVIDLLNDIRKEIKKYDSGCGWDGYIKKDEADMIIKDKINNVKG